MKKILLVMPLLGLSLIFPISILQAQSQLKTVDKFGNQKLAQVGVEPWSIQNTTNPSTAVADNIYHIGNVGIGDFSTSSIAQKLEVNGNARFRVMPAVLYTAITATNYPNMVVAQADGTLGVSKMASAGVTANDAATTMFVIKRYAIPTSTPLPLNWDTQMSTAKWEAIMGNAQYSSGSGSGSPFVANSTFGFTVTKGATNWMITGTFSNYSTSGGIIDVLFIKKSITAADNRCSFV